MNEYLNRPVKNCEQANHSWQKSMHDNSTTHENQVVNIVSKLIPLTNSSEINYKGDILLFNGKEPKIDKESFIGPPEKKCGTSQALTSQQPGNLFRLFVKNGEYVYARPNDIIMMESCDHMVKVYLGLNDKIKKTIRHNTLKDFLLQLPQGQFMRIGRFCAVNIHRLSGGNCNEQTFEFDFQVSIKLKHAIAQAAFNSIGK